MLEVLNGEISKRNKKKNTTQNDKNIVIIYTN